MIRPVRWLLGMAIAGLLGCQTTSATTSPAPTSAPAPPPSSRPPAPVDTTTGTKAPARLTATAAKRLLITDVTVDPHRPKLPARLDRDGARYLGLYRICVGGGGQIDSITVNKGTGDGQLDTEWMTTIRTWRYRPLEMSGRKVPFCYVASVEASAAS